MTTYRFFDVTKQIVVVNNELHWASWRLSATTEDALRDLLSIAARCGTLIQSLYALDDRDQSLLDQYK
jgi:hypothetical protein